MTPDAPSLRRFLIAIAVISGLIVAVAAPAGYWFLKHSTESAQLEVETQASARRVSRYVYANGRMWVFQHHRLEDVLAGNRSAGGDQVRRLFGPDGKLILEQGRQPASAISNRLPIVVDGNEVGQVEIMRGMSRYLAITVWIAVGSALFGVFIFAVVYFFPMRALNRAFLALRGTNARLTQTHADLQDKHRVLSETNAQLELARTQAEAANRAKSQFLANMSHELRTPLNAVIGFTEMIQGQFAGPIGQKNLDYLADVHKSGVHLLKIVNDVLTHSRMEDGTLRIAAAPLEVKSLMEDCCQLVAGDALAAKLTLSCDAAFAAGATVMADSAQLKLVLLNLLGNAIKFTRPGGNITMSGSRTSGQVNVRITDSGIGMTVDEIFVAVQRLRQVDESHTRRFGGIGLGLPIAKTIVELHKGTMRIESAPGKGTTVTVSLAQLGSVASERTAINGRKQDVAA